MPRIKSALPLALAFASLAISGRAADAQIKKLGVFELTNQAYGKALSDAAPAQVSFSSGAVYAADYRGVTAQQWEIYSLPNGNYILINHENGFALTSDPTRHDGGPNAIYEEHFYASLRQQWKLRPMGNSLFVLVNAGSNLTLTAPGKTTIYDAYLVTEAPYANDQNQYWKITLLHF